MTQAEFVEITSEIESFYDKELSTNVSRIWYEELKYLTKERYRQIARECYRNLKFMPKLADVVEINRIARKNQPVETKQKLEDCDKCNGTGIVLYTQYVEGTSYQYGARCTCKNATQWSSKIPSIQQLGLVQ